MHCSEKVLRQWNAFEDLNLHPSSKTYEIKGFQQSIYLTSLTLFTLMMGVMPTSECGFRDETITRMGEKKSAVKSTVL